MNTFWQDYYSSLEGATILSFDGMTGEEADIGISAFPTFTAKLKNGLKVTLEISQDPEGNGGGFIFGLPHPKKVSE